MEKYYFTENNGKFDHELKFVILRSKDDSLVTSTNVESRAIQHVDLINEKFKNRDPKPIAGRLGSNSYY